MKAIETNYKNYRMRSKLEARWATFFDALGVKFDYEPEGFDIDGVWYLPDFWLPEQKMWVEIKPNIELMRAEESKLIAFQKGLNEQDEFTDFYIFVGNPFADIEHFDYEVYYVFKDESLNILEEHWAQCPMCKKYNILAVAKDYNEYTPEAVQCDLCGWNESTAAHLTEELLGAYIAARMARFDRKTPPDLEWNLRAAEIFSRENAEPF